MSPHFPTLHKVGAVAVTAALVLLGLVVLPQAASAATIYVDDLSDDGTSDTLRGAIDAANLTDGPDIIEIRVPGTITISTATIDVTAGVYIYGATTGAGTTLTRDFSGDMFTVAMSGTSFDRDFTMLDVELQGTNGVYTGRAVTVTSVNPARNLGFYNSYFFGFTGAAFGGAVAVEGTSGGFTADSTDFTNNAASGAGPADGGGTVYLKNVAGAIQFSSVNLQASSAERGGGIYVDSPTASVTIVGSQISAATATGDGGGGVFVQSAASVSVQSSTFTSNQSQNAGGGLSVDAVPNTAIIDSTFSQNESLANRGGALYANQGTLTVESSLFSFNTALSSTGGAIGTLGTLDSLRVIDSDFHDNIAVEGGAILVDGYTGNSWVTGSTFRDNVAKDQGVTGRGGAISFGSAGVPAPFTITATTFESNAAYRVTGGGVIDAPGYAGAIYSAAVNDELLIEDSTFRDNSLGIAGSNFGVSIFIDASLVQGYFGIVNSTFSEPAPNYAVYVDGFSGGAEFVVAHTTFTTDYAIAINANTTASRVSHAIFDSAPNAIPIFINSGPPLAVEWSLFRAPVDAAIAATNTAFSVPTMLLGPLQNNGGPTETRMPLPGSPAIDKGNPAAVLLPAYDQREAPFDRVVNSIVDIGAVEALVTSATLPDTGSTISPFTPIIGSALLLLGVGAMIFTQMRPRRGPARHAAVSERQLRRVDL